MQRVEGGSGWHARRAEDASPTLHIVYERLVAERSGRPLCTGTDALSTVRMDGSVGLRAGDGRIS